MDALCRLDYQAASQYCTWKLLETTWKCFVSFWMASAIESLSLLSSLSRCNQNWTHTIMHHAFKTWCIVSTNGRYATSGVLTAFEKLKEHPLSLCWCLASGASGFFARVYLRTAETSICQVPYYACWFSFGCVWYAENGFFRPRFADWYKIILDDEICHALTYNTSWPDWTAHYALRHCCGHTT